MADDEARNILFVGRDPAAFSAAMEALEEDGRGVQCVASAFKALTAHTRSPFDLIIVDASGLDDQMLEAFEALKEVAPRGLLFAAMTPAARGRAARVLTLGADAVIGLPADADEVRALARKLQRPEAPAARVSVDEKFAWLGEFAGGVAHNINNPLTTVVGYLQILRANGGSREQTENVLSVMLRECDRIAEVVKNLLLFSGNGSFQPHAVDVNRVVDAALVLAGAEAENNRVRTERSYQPGLPAVVADEEALKLACQNIAVNARRAMQDGGTLSVETSQSPDGPVVIRFSDTGPGIPPDKVDKVFEPFYTGGNGASVGLGLATSYGIIKGFGGRIEVAADNGSGSTFVVELPANA